MFNFSLYLFYADNKTLILGFDGIILHTLFLGFDDVTTECKYNRVLGAFLFS